MKWLKRIFLSFLGLVLLIEIVPVSWAWFSFDQQCKWVSNSNSHSIVLPRKLGMGGDYIYPVYDRIEGLAFPEKFRRRGDPNPGPHVKYISISSEAVNLKGAWLPIYKEGSFNQLAMYSFSYSLSLGCDEMRISISGSLNISGTFTAFGLVSRRMLKQNIENFTNGIIRDEAEKEVVKALREKLSGR